MKSLLQTFNNGSWACFWKWIQNKDKPEEAIHRCSLKYVSLKILYMIFTRNHLCWSLFLKELQAWMPASLSKKTPTKGFSCEYCKIFKNAVFYIAHPVAASGKHIKIKLFTYIPFVTFQCLQWKLLKNILQHGLQDFVLKRSSWGFLPTDSFWKLLICLLPTSKLSQKTRSFGVKIWVAISQIFPGFKCLVFGRNLVKMSLQNKCFKARMWTETSIRWVIRNFFIVLAIWPTDQLTF